LVETTPTLLVKGEGTGPNKTKVIVRYRSGSIITLGPEDVVAGDGLAITATIDFYPFELGEGNNLYGVVAVGTARIQVLAMTEV